MDTSYIAPTVNAKKHQMEVNVGKTVSLIWTYNTVGVTYEVIVWGKGDSEAVNFEYKYFGKKPNQGSPSKVSDLDAGIASRVKIVGRSSLVISDAKLSDEGYYMCEITTNNVRVKSNIYLKVYGE